MFCKHCGKEIDEDSTFCRYCGKTVTQNTVNANNRDTSDAPADDSEAVDSFWDDWAEGNEQIQDKQPALAQEEAQRQSTAEPSFDVSYAPAPSRKVYSKATVIWTNIAGIVVGYISYALISAIIIMIGAMISDIPLIVRWFGAYLPFILTAVIAYGAGVRLSAMIAMAICKTNAAKTPAGVWLWVGYLIFSFLYTSIILIVGEDSGNVMLWGSLSGLAQCLMMSVTFVSINKSA